jgi:hypothetical protein
MLTEGVSITPRPSPISSSPGANDQGLDDAAWTRPEQKPDAGRRHDEAGGDQGLLLTPLGQPLGRERGNEHAEGRRGEDHAGLDRAVVALGLEEDRDDERHAHQQQPLEVLGDHPQVRGAVAEQVERQQRILAPALPRPDVHEEPGQERESDR